MTITEKPYCPVCFFLNDKHHYDCKLFDTKSSTSNQAELFTLNSNDEIEIPYYGD